MEVSIGYAGLSESGVIMKKRSSYLKTLLWFFIYLIIDIIILFIFWNMVARPTYIQENNIIKEKCEEDIIQKIERIASNVSFNNVYKLITYDCTQFSEELVNQLKNSNISAYCVSGALKKDNKWGGHIWVEVIIDNQIIPIEATGGFIIDNQTYKEDYKILKKGFCL